MTAPHYNGQSDPRLQAIAEAERRRYRNAHANGHDHTVETPEPLVCTPFAVRSMTAIAPRAWAYGDFLLFGSASVIGAVDGGGKGVQAVAIALSMITGQALLGEKVWRKGKVAIITYEDDEDEWSRRIAAACLEYGLEFEQVIDSFHIITRPRDRIRLAAMSATDRTVVFPDGDAIIAELQRIGAALLIVDPFNHAHTMEDGNSNAMVAQLASEISRIAARSNVAALVLHHLRKGSVGSSDDLMGAVMLRATFRSARVLVRMSADEAEKLGVPPEEAFRYSRISGSKENYSPPPDRCTWYKFESHNLGNGAGIYTAGDNVHAVVRWTPPDAFEGMPKADIADIFDAFRAGPGDGEFYSSHGNAQERWGGNVIMEFAVKDEFAARRILSTWVENGVLIEDEYRSPKRKRDLMRLVVNEAKAAEILGALYRAPREPGS